MIAIRSLLRVVRVEPVLAPEERSLAGVVNGVVYAIGGVTLPVTLVLPGITQAHAAVVIAIAAVTLVWGLCSIRVIRWASAPPWLLQFSTAAGLALIAAAVASTGGAVSPVWVYLFYVAVFTSYFYRRHVAYVYLLACAASQALPLAYDSRALQDGFIGQTVISAAAYVVLGAAIIAGKRMMLQDRSRAQALATEQGALRRVATAVVGGRSPERIYELAAFEVATLLGAGAAGILRFDSDERATVMGSWADHPGGRYQPGTEIPVRPGGDVEQARDAGVPVRIEGHAPASPVGRLGYAASIVAPVTVAGRTWGALAVTATDPTHFTLADEQRLMAFGDLLATAIASIEDRAKLAAQASSDPLTALANHRSLQQALAAEIARAKRHDRPLSVAVLDVDQFKQINDNAGHDAGDVVLVRVAGCLSKLARTEDTLARVGGDEFVWVLPETSGEQALIAVERARQVIAKVISSPYAVTVSAGICDTAVTDDPTKLIRFADGALYWSKAHGRNQSWIYDPEVVAELSAEERAERLERSHALVGLRALARAIDAKDPATRRHSERVAELVEKLARTVGWSPERARLLGEAALVHDVGKIGVPDELLRKPAPLTLEERARVSGHAELSAKIVEDVLAPDQVEWIRTHHERPDGEGYPDGLRDDEIPEGGALLSLADAWDVMTVSRPYSLPKSIDAALEECVRLTGKQFSPASIDALRALYGAGELSLEGLGHAQDGLDARQVASG